MVSALLQQYQPSLHSVIVRGCLSHTDSTSCFAFLFSICSSVVAVYFDLFCILAIMSALERSLRYYRKQIEKLIYTVSAALDQHITAETCVLFESADTELAKLRSDYSNTVEKILHACSDEEFEDKCDTLTEAQDSLFESCRLTMAKSKSEILRFRGAKARDSLAGPPLSSTVLQSFDASVMPSHYPKIKIPTFSGDYRHFMRFKGIFMNLVHEVPAMSNIRKLYYLQEALEGDAARLIEDLPITEDAYEEAWSRVLGRYDNHKALVLIYFRELLSVQNLPADTNLRTLLDTVTNALNNLKLCGLPTDNWGDLIAYLVYQCLDTKNREDFDNSQAESTKFFTWKALHSFLKGRAYCSETRLLAEKTTPNFSRQEEKPVDTTQAKTVLAMVTREQCVACTQHHLLIACPAFAALSPKEKFELISKNRMCSNCFGKSHSVRNCEGKGTCRLCGQRHHTLLHFPKRTSIPAAISVETKPSSAVAPVAPSAVAPVSSVAPASATKPEKKPEVPTTILVQQNRPEKTVFLPTAIVKIVLEGKRVITARALLDS